MSKARERGGEKPSFSLSKEASPLMRGFFWTGLFSAAVNLLMLVSPLFMMQVFDRVLSSGRVETLVLLGVIAVVAFICYGFMEWVRGRLMARLGAWLEDRLAQPTLMAGLRARLRGVPGTGQGVRDLQQVRGFLSSPGIFPFFDAPWVPIFIITLWILHPAIGIFATVTAVLLFALAIAGDLITRKPQAKVLEQTLAAQRQADAAIDQAEAVTALGMRPALVRRWNAVRHEASDEQIGVGERGTMVTAWAKALRQIVQVGILGLGAWLVLIGQLTPGGMIAGSILLGRALAPIDQAISAWRTFMTVRLAWRRLDKLLADTPTEPPPLPLPKPQGSLVVSQLGFRAPGANAADKFLLQGVSFGLEPGDALGVIGPSGAGKSTLCRLITGLHAPTLGDVRLDGASLEQWDIDKLGVHLGYLPQDVGLPPATVAETIARLAEAPPEAVIAAAQLAQAHDMILGLPKGYDTPIGAGGVPLSGGQRQRVGLARALFGEPSLVVLDEAAAHLDLEGETALQQAIRGLKERGATVILIAHRPSLVRHMDKLLVLQKGRMTQFGPRDEVLEKIAPAAVPLRKVPG
ncbi:MAG: type I secretion system permease/ATPase [Pseudomonadota bacterium]